MPRIVDGRSRVLESQDVVELLAPKWRITVLHLLRDGSLRTSELQSAMEEISAKVWTETLRGMERDGLIERKVHPVAPPRVEYGLTEMGRNMLIPLQDLCHRAKAHIPQRDAARKWYDSLKLGQIPDRVIGKSIAPRPRNRFR